MLNIARKVKAKHPDVPVILFPRGVGHATLLQLAQSEGFDCLAIDEQTDLQWAVDHIAPLKVIQGNMDNAVLLTTPETVKKEITRILEIAGHLPNYVVNLGHGVLPPTPVENVEMFVNTVQNWGEKAVNSTAEKRA
jgi:uroporphyrinogen decarboxylase